MRFSIIVCTYNRAGMLSSVLKDLAHQEFSPEEYEILIIDNNSIDQTAQTVMDFCAHYSNFRYFLEEKIGLSHARNRGFQESKGDYVGYTDDDCRIPSDWLQKASYIAKTLSPIIYGGPWLPFYTKKKPYWYQDKYDTFAEGNYPKISGYQEKLLPSGANLFFQRQVLESCGGFNPQLGMRGRNLGYEEETQVQRRILSSSSGPGAYFDPNLIIYHWVNPMKMTVNWKLKQQYILGRNIFQSRVKYKLKATPIGYLKVFARMVLIGFSLLISPANALTRERKKYPYIENYYYEVISKKIFKFGYLFEYYKHMGA